ncbi:hypothetical protein [Xylanimonas oleitrophica]|uniref:hypothetical protein n=1 Tax=Xylanimonas oleitrophica TaxID=2607479 RepID=UPI001FE770D9|nr:hypothetical protein [Xylanimonas oleitrophica]
MNAHAVALYPTRSTTRTELHGLDRALVLAGQALAEAGRRRAAARAERAARALASGARDTYRDAALERRRDNAAQVHPLTLR